MCIVSRWLGSNTGDGSPPDRMARVDPSCVDLTVNADQSINQSLKPLLGLDGSELFVVFFFLIFVLFQLAIELFISLSDSIVKSHAVVLNI